MSFCRNWCTAWNRYIRNFSCLITVETSCVPKYYKSMYCCLIQYFIVRIRIVNAHKQGKRFRYEIFPRINTRYAHEYTVFAHTQLLRNWPGQRPSNKVTFTRVSKGRLEESYTAQNPLLISLLDISTWLLCCVKVVHSIHSVPRILCRVYSVKAA
jgi:hypothetical protein